MVCGHFLAWVSSDVAATVVPSADWWPFPAQRPGLGAV